MSEWISPYSWQEILDKFPLDYTNGTPIAISQVPEGRQLRAVADKAGQYGDLLEHGHTYVDVRGIKQRSKHGCKPRPTAAAANPMGDSHGSRARRSPNVMESHSASVTGRISRT